MSNEHAYVQLSFSDETKSYFHDVVNSLVKPEELYYSSVIQYIHGDVTKNLHMTLFFGLDLAQTDNPDLLELLESVELRELEVTGLALTKGYQNLYKVLKAQIDDSQGYWENVADRIKSFRYDQKSSHNTFEPHITLSYVQPTYILPEHNIEFHLLRPISIEIAKI